MKGILLFTVILLLPFSIVIAQDDTCPEFVQNTYNMTRDVCDSIGSDEACYGNISIDAEPESLDFQQSGDIVPVTDIESMRLSSMDVEQNEWGISLMRVDVVPSEDDAPIRVEMVLFGDVTIENSQDDDSEFGAMQAFTFSSGIDDRPCDEAPDSGVLIQTAEGAGEISLLVNEVVIDIGSTLYLQAEPGSEMQISVVEGQATVTAFGTTINTPAGSVARVPLDDDGIAEGAPEGPEPYEADALLPLPVALLTEQVAIAPPIEPEGSASTSEAEGTLTFSEWQFTITNNSCDLNVIGETFNGEIGISDDGETLVWPIIAEDSGEFSQVEPGVYVNENDDATLRVERIAEDEMRLVITWNDGCKDIIDVVLVSAAE